MEYQDYSSLCLEGLLALLSGHFEDAIEAYKEAITLDPDDNTAYLGIGAVLQMIGFLNDDELTLMEAAELLRDVIRRKPDSFEAHSDLGLVYWSLGHFNEAAENLAEAVRLKPDCFPEIYYLLGVCYDELARYNEAIETFQALLRLKPNHEKAYFRLGLIYSRIHNRRGVVEEDENLKEQDQKRTNELFKLVMKGL